MDDNEKELKEEMLGQDLTQSDEIEIDNTTSPELFDEGPDHDVEKAKKVQSGIRHTFNKAKKINDTSPELTSGDIDADWVNEPNTSGDETSMGDNATPDQDQVDELARPWGLARNNEELNLNKKRRDLENEKKHDEEEQLRPKKS